MSSECSMVQKPLSPIMDRYRAMLKEREADLRVSLDIENVPPPSREEIMRLFELLLSDLTLNSKPIITDLTIIAGEQREHGEGIADTICARIFEVPVEQKLPSLYLVDSIVKNIGKEYIRHFSPHLPQVFWEAYRQVHPNLHPSMRHLFKTWSTVFPPAVLRKIEAQLELPPPENAPPSGLATLRAPESPQTSHGIHANPRYMEERRQLEHSTLDSNNQHALKISDQKPASAHDGYVAHGRHETPATFKNGIELQTPRALIDAYGNDQRSTQPNNNSLNVNSNSTHHRPGTRTWQNTEEEEYNWEAMSPTSVDHRRTNELQSLPVSNLESIRERPGCGKNNTVILESDFRRTNQLCPAQMSVVNDSSATFGVGFPPLNSGTERKPTVHSFPDANARDHCSIVGAQELKSEAPPATIPSSFTGVWPPVNTQKHNLLPPLPLPPPPRRPMMSPFEAINSSKAFLNRSINMPFSPQHQFDGIKSNTPNSTKQLPLPSFLNQQGGHVNSNSQHQAQGGFLRPQLLSSQQVRQNLPPSSVVPMNWMPPPLTHGAPSVVSMTSLPRPLTHGYPSQRQNNVFNSFAPNPVPGPHRPFMPILNTPNSSLHWQGGGYPPLPPGTRPSPSQMIPIPQNSAPPPPPSQQPGGALSGLIGSLMAQGLLSLNKPSPAQDTVGVEFDPDILKVRHESVITALYADLPRQCTTCGLRFKSQEDHRSHMDWHVTRNRTSKNQKQKPSRRWFASLNMWLTGAEALGSDAAPSFLQTESVVEKKDDEELAVPADEDQTACALCGEPFDDFYSDETEEWMYKGAVYLNASNGSTSGLNRTQLGPIVHAKCMSDTSVVPAGASGKHERGFMEEGIERKRLRIC